MNEEQMNEFINSIGAFAEMSAIFYKGLLSNGVSSGDAIVLTGAFISTLIPHI